MGDVEGVLGAQGVQVVRTAAAPGVGRASGVLLAAPPPGGGAGVWGGAREGLGAPAVWVVAA